MKQAFDNSPAGSDRAAASMTPGQLSEVARSVGGKLPLKDRWLFTYRPRICPFHILLKYIPAQARILDIGCGMGLWLFLLSRLERIASGTGFDVNEPAIVKAESLKSDRDNLRFLHQSPEAPWPAGSYDCISMIDVLHHVPAGEQKRFLGQVTGTTARRMVFKDIDPSAKLKAAMNTLHDVLLSHQRPRYCDPEQVVGWLEEMGFAILAKARHDMLWYSHYLIVAEKQRP